MKRKQWLAGILAAGLLCALPLSGAFAAPRAATRGTAPADAGAGITLTVDKAAAVYGDTITFTAEYTPGAGGPVPASGGKAVFFVGNNELGSAELQVQASSPGTYKAVFAYDTTSKKEITVGVKKIVTAQYSPASGSPLISSGVDVTLAAKPLTASPKGAVTYNGTAAFQNVPLDLAGVEPGDKVEAKADLTLQGKDVGNQTVTAAQDPAKTKSAQGAAKAAATITLTGDQKDFYTLPAASVAGSLNIEKAPLSLTAGAEDKPYDGTEAAQAKNLSFSGLQNGETLTETTDYTVSAKFKDGADASDSEKEVEVTVHLNDTAAAKNYDVSGTYTAKAYLYKKQLTVESIGLKPKTYDGTTDAAVERLTLGGFVGGDSLELNTDYTVSAQFADANAGGDKDVKLVFAEKDASKFQNYLLPLGNPMNIEKAGSIAPRPLEQGMVSFKNANNDFVYDGTEKKPELVVQDGALLTAGDYEVVYKNNSQGGTATATVQAKGNYTGSVELQFPIQKAEPGLSVTAERRVENGKAVLRVTVNALQASTSAAWPTGSVDVAVQAGGDKRQAAGTFSEGKFTVDLPDLAGVTQAQVKASYYGDTNYTAETKEQGAALAPAPTPAPTAKPEPTSKPAPTPAPTPKPFDWYPALGSIQSVKSGKVTIDSGGEIAVPHFIWQAFYGKDITLTITHGSEKYVFNGLDLKASGFDPDNGHNLTDLRAYIGRSYEKPKASAAPAPTASPKPTASPAPTAAPTASPLPTAAPATPEPSVQPAQGGGASNWLYWVIGGAAVLLIVLAVVLVVLRRKSSRQDPYGYNE